MVQPLTLAASRDPAVFADPDRLDLGRDLSRSVVFGKGRNFCLGAQLARLELTTAITKIFERLPDLRMTCGYDEVPMKRNPATRGTAALPLAFEPSGTSAAEDKASSR
jgi:biflaviolin synthase